MRTLKNYMKFFSKQNFQKFNINGNYKYKILYFI